jgi:hypothetical protein
MENIQTLLERYGRYNRLIGDYRSWTIQADITSDKFKDARRSLDRCMVKLAEIENTLVDMGLLNEDDRHSNRGES